MKMFLKCDCEIRGRRDLKAHVEKSFFFPKTHLYSGHVHVNYSVIF